MLGVFASVAASVPRQPPGVASALRRSDRCSRQLSPTGDKTGDACRATLISRSRWSVESTPSLGCPDPMRSRRVVKRPPAHIKSPHRTDLLRETPRARIRPGRPRTVAVQRVDGVDRALPLGEVLNRSRGRICHIIEDHVSNVMGRIGTMLSF